MGGAGGGTIIRDSRVVADKNDLVKYNDINNEVFSYFNSLFERTDQIDNLDHNTLLQSIILP